MSLSKFLIGSLFAVNFTSDIDVSHVGWFRLPIGAFILADFSVLQQGTIRLSHSTKQFRFEFEFSDSNTIFPNLRKTASNPKFLKSSSWNKKHNYGWIIGNHFFRLFPETFFSLCPRFKNCVSFVRIAPLHCKLGRYVNKIKNSMKRITSTF